MLGLVTFLKFQHQWWSFPTSLVALLDTRILPCDLMSDQRLLFVDRSVKKIFFLLEQLKDLAKKACCGKNVLLQEVSTCFGLFPS